MPRARHTQIVSCAPQRDLPDTELLREADALPREDSKYGDHVFDSPRVFIIQSFYHGIQVRRQAFEAII